MFTQVAPLVAAQGTGSQLPRLSLSVMEALYLWRVLIFLLWLHSLSPTRPNTWPSKGRRCEFEAAVGCGEVWLRTRGRHQRVARLVSPVSFVKMTQLTHVHLANSHITSHHPVERVTAPFFKFF